MVSKLQVIQRDDINNLRDNLAPFNVKSTEYMKRCLDPEIRISIAEGGKRAGKNVMNISMFCARIEHHSAKTFVVSGVTKFLAMENIMECNGYGIVSYFQGNIRQGWLHGHEAYFVKTKTGVKTILPFGGGKSDDHKKLQGLTIGGWYGTEMNLHHPNFVKEMQSRMLSFPDRILFGDLNPLPPGHYFYKVWLDIWMERQKLRDEEIKAFEALPKEEQERLEQDGLKPRPYGFNYEHFTILDNMSIDDETLLAVLDMYDEDSVFFKMDILGQRSSAFGAIYTSFRAKEVYLDPQEARDAEFYKFSLGIDVGGTDATVASLMAYTAGFKHAVLLDGYYHKQGKANAMFDDAYYVNEICDRIDAWVPKYGLTNVDVFGDSADKNFRIALQKELRRRGYNWTVTPSYKKNGIINRIRLNQTLITQSRFFIVNRPHLAPWVEAFENASWDEKKFNEGELVRLDNGSVPIDCLDSLEYGLEPYQAYLV